VPFHLRPTRRLRRVGDVDEGPHAAAIADQQELALADELDLLGALGRPQDIEDGELFVLQTRPVTA
jgi:hypothetical protein